jgi:ribosomal protein S12 methylthiotransferase
MKKKLRVGVVTLGCSKNTVDSERLIKQLEGNNFKLAGDPEKADIVIINTCGFIEAAKEESVNTVLNAVELKRNGNIKKVIVAGCLSERYRNDLITEIPEVDAFFGTEAYESILKEIGGEFKYELLGERSLTTPKHYAYLKISEGCNNPCSFCAIPLMRGKHHSKSMDELLNETKFLADHGTKEIIIIGQDTTDYGIDIYGRRNLAELINKISEVNGIEWIRLLYTYPSHLQPDVMDVINDNPKVCKYIDIPLQHISGNVLKSMRRGITTRRTREILDTIKTKIPGLTIRTTFIVGYPNETEKDFNELYDFVKEYQFDRVGTFTYSVEEDTSGFILGDPVPNDVKEDRKQALMELQKEISLQKNELLVNKKLRVIVDNNEDSGDEKIYVARSEKDAPEVDGEVLIRSGRVLKPGNFYDVIIDDYNEYDLFGKIE